MSKFESLLKSIERVQEQYHLNDSQLANRLEVDAGHISAIKHEVTPPGAKVLGALMREFPELTADVVRYMAAEKSTTNPTP